MRSPIWWFGGKGSMVKKLLPLIPNHKFYIEPFFGGGSVFFAKNLSKHETINDLNQAVMDFYRVLRDEKLFPKFYRLVYYTPYSRQLYNEYRKTWKTETDKLQKVYKWFCVARMSFSGYFGSCFGTDVIAITNNQCDKTSSFNSIKKLLPVIHKRLSTTQIENKSAIDVLKQYVHNDECFSYLDPPYVTSTRSSGNYEHEMDDVDHRELLRTVLELPGKFLISGYNNELYNDYLKGWNMQEWKTSCHAAGRTKNSGLKGKGNVLKNQGRIEKVWYNYDIQAKLFDY